MMQEELSRATGDLGIRVKGQFNQVLAPLKTYTAKGLSRAESKLEKETI